MYAITNYFKDLTNLSMPVTHNTTRFEAQQPSVGERDCLDMEYFFRMS